MKKTMITLITLLASELCLAYSLPNGSYHGNGLWNSLTAQGGYQTSAVIDNNRINGHYTLQDGSTLDWNFEMQATSSVFFDVLNHGEKLGTGYCLEKASLCHYEISVGSLKLEESLVQQGNKIYRYGSKDEGRGPIMWQESLDKE
ncbi:MAG TPA: hypothetical protein VN132_09850 [Bdellovibrio sp.]|nr:hypothetical protein [Bdellovibrio sp.]